MHLPVAGADPGFFLGGGALVSCSTSTPINHIVFFFCRIPVVLENRRSSQGGGGGAHPLPPPPRSAPAWIALHTLFFVKTLYFTWVYQTLGLRLVAGVTLTKPCLIGCHLFAVESLFQRNVWTLRVNCRRFAIVKLSCRV